MLITIAVTLAIVTLCTAGMAVGVIFSDRELKGSCGGVGGSCACDDAGIPRKCEEEGAQDENSADAPGATSSI